MGFFSAIKKFLGGNEGQETATDAPKAPQPPQPKAATPHDNAVPSEQLAEPSQGEHLAPSVSQSEPHAMSSVHDEPQAASSAHDEPQAMSSAHDEPHAASSAHDEPHAASSAHDEPHAASSAHDEPHAALALQLREAEPRLSVWLGIILEGVSESGPLLWQRLHYLLRSLDAPQAEADTFVADFESWLARMEYRHVEEFRSELQYRLALALDMEDEEDERSRLFLKLSQGLTRTREQFTRRLDALFASHGALDAAFWEEMEELFLMADVGYEATNELIERLKDRARQNDVTEPAGLRDLLWAELEEIFRVPRRISAINPPEVVLMIGVNGVGKTTTIAKLAHRDRMQGKKVLIAAADTFRAAATEQLGVWAQRVGADFHCKEAGADPAAVAFEGMDKALKGNYDVLYVDTAGRLQTKTNLMEELKKIRTVLGKKHPGAPHRSVLVIDATTGQNALSQTKLFKEAAGVDEVILTKLDGTAKGGVAIAVAMQFQVPITYVGLGEKLEDLRPFNGQDFASALLGVEKTTG